MKKCKKNHEYTEELKQCPECRKIRMREWHMNNSEIYNAKKRATYKANPEKYKAKQKANYKANPEKIGVATKNWQKANKGKCAAITARRRAAKYKATPKWLTKEQHAEITHIYEICAKIQELTGITHHVDHIIPLQGENVSGLHVPWNLQLLTKTENIKKGNKF